MSVTVGTEQPVSHALHTTASMQSDAGCHYAVETQPADLQTASAAEQTAANSTAGESVSMSASISLTPRAAGSSPSADVTAPGSKSTRAVLTAPGSQSTRADSIAPGSKSCRTGLTAPGSNSPAAALAAPEGVMGPWSIKASSGRLNAADEMAHKGGSLVPPTLCLVCSLTLQHLRTQHCMTLLCGCGKDDFNMY